MLGVPLVSYHLPAPTTDPHLQRKHHSPTSHHTPSQYEQAASTTEIPTTWGHKYDPSHPAADFAGLVDVDAQRQRRHVSQHRSQNVHITVGSAGGLTGTEQKKEHTDIKKVTNVCISA
jgi:hypothetical protein